jgi:hypothetical protein
MAEDDRRISLAGKVLVNTIDAQLLEVQKQGQVVGFGVALTMVGRFHRRNERSTTTYLLYREDMRGSSVSCSMRRPTPIRRGAIRYLASSGWRWTSNAESNEAPLLEAIAAAWARRLELWPAS